MRRTCDNKQTNIVTEVFFLSIVHYRVLFAYCIMLTKRRAGLLKLGWVDLSVIAILLCTFIVHSGVKWGWGTTDSPSVWILKILFTTSRSLTSYGRRRWHTTFNWFFSKLACTHATTRCKTRLRRAGQRSAKRSSSTCWILANVMVPGSLLSAPTSLLRRMYGSVYAGTWYAAWVCLFLS